MTKLLIVLLVGTLWACEEEVATKKDSNVLKVEVQPKGYLGVGYGEVYPCTVLNVLEGTFTSDSLLLTILAGDTLNSKLLASSKDKLTISFKKHKEKEPYQMMPISGMVDANKTSWLITGIKMN